MKRKQVVHASVCLAVLGLASLGHAGVPEPPVSICVMANAPSGVNLNVCNVPDGSGYPATQARQVATSPGTWEDATITVTLLDGGYNPVFGYPLEDMWLENLPAVPPGSVWDVPGLVACPNGTVADADTDINGVTTFSGPFHAGGHVDYTDNGDDSDDGMTYVFVNGNPLINSPLRLLFNSPDINGDGVVDTASDVVIFSTRYPPEAGYSYSVDLYFDERNDISDLVLFSAGLNTACP